ncbi:bifunctional phosphopantothenoylcysteine decarboxylase/phosphopantothenate--cysteine ligase CoaBC [Alysiella filiformis]|uniref:Coenzyme A biosynthesis bifunctional protein CoaBC n=1 Tax=Alysiella filiformis DSM 16848 TaxID=1120981 RepID=A0A286E228_9NEIS|nr:bifunctional phosphopantothenoylcysteine decarboxylase/phosphopantothenate--cysteine ligase CoaBC [Alysiella filiformis]QMT30851.1 bifunctional phosphopantothenoylcysteine decarboxylase/phosphopantothenate--cysteine ligase CoaBC [Alysiella filiformis]UBQ56168.1 bifunctional phosphopantothenoylcysteine decarboxylase/phosphopantothenate--cysteine ligase CoaBC [Alysiella filiformis DSM 16848]SOD64968.1 phosphopantothenoylcysteine decarboxylase / phosphopantothenate--cysteine ligase [Alysiella fi
MQKHILLAITGGIAAYKSCELVRLLKKQGHHITVAMSQAATEFVAPQTFQALSGNPVLTEQGGAGNGMAHINATRAADIMLIAPATANTLAKIAHGIADNLITEMVAARNCPLVVAPAMNVEMWHNPANLRNIKQLAQDGVHVLQPAAGEQACGETGVGRMQEPSDIAELLPDFWLDKPLLGKKVVLTVGASYEAIDPVRGITNISSGQMGVALARACRQAGAQVDVIYANLQVPLPKGMAYTEQAQSAQAMYDAVFRRLDLGADVFIGVAAVADYRVKNRATQKLKKDGSGSPPVIELTENPDILQAVAQRENAPFCVGFAAESENVLAYARAKRAKKGVPLLVANDVSVAMGQSSNQIIMLDDEQETALPEMSKDAAAQAIVSRLATLLARSSD